MNGKLMKERRRALGMTQMQLASVPKLKKLAEVLGVSMEELLEDGEDE